MGDTLIGLEHVIEQLKLAAVGPLERGQPAHKPSIGEILREVVLVEAVRQGDDQATRVLLGKVEPLVNRALTRLGGQRAAQEKEDYVNDLWVPRGSAPPRLDNFHGRAPLGSWVETVVTRLWFDQRRKQEREPVIDLNDQVQPGTASAAGGSVHYGECINQIVQGFLEIADTHEDREQLLVWLMYRFDGVQQKQIAALFSPPVSTSTISRYCARVEEKVRKTFEVNAALESSLAAVFEAPEAVRRDLAAGIVEALKAHSQQLRAAVRPDVADGDTESDRSRQRRLP